MTEVKDLEVVPGWHEFKVVTYHGGFDCFLDGELVHKVELPSYSTLDAVADTTEDEVIVKIVNFCENEDEVDIALDCDVQADYCVKCLTGGMMDGNSIEEPEKVKAVEFCATGAAKNFTYKAPAWSLSILRLKK